MEYPFLIERTELRKNSCGDGKWRGGLGMRRDVRLMLSDGYLSVVSDRNVIPPFGIAGALSATPTASWTTVEDSWSSRRPWPGSDQFPHAQR